MDTQPPVHKADRVIVNGRSLRGLVIVGGDGVPYSHRQGDMPVKQRWKHDCCGVGRILLTAGYCVRTSPWTDDCYVGEMSQWRDERHQLPAGRHESLPLTAVDHATSTAEAVHRDVDTHDLAAVSNPPYPVAAGAVVSSISRHCQDWWYRNYPSTVIRGTPSPSATQEQAAAPQNNTSFPDKPPLHTVPYTKVRPTHQIPHSYIREASRCWHLRSTRGP